MVGTLMDALALVGLLCCRMALALLLAPAFMVFNMLVLY